MILVNEPHELLKAMLSLLALLLGRSVLVRLFLPASMLILVAVLRFIKSNLNGYQVGLHPLDHVLILSLGHEGFRMRFPFTI